MSESIKDLINDFKEGKIEAVSKHKLRDESKQERNKVERLGTLKKEAKLKEKLLFITELAIPFNPSTGKEDEQFNREQKFRPYLAQSTVMRLVKGLCNESPEAKEVFMKKAGITEWETAGEELTDIDKKIFARYRVPRVYTLPVAKVNIPAFTGNAFGKDYLINVEKDPDNGQIVGELPLILKVNKLMSDMAFEELTEMETKIKDGELTYTKKEKEDAVRAVWAKVVVSGEYPLNYTTAVGIKLNSKSELADDLREMEPADMFENLILVRRNKEIKTSLDKYTNGEFSAIDYYNDFWEFDMNCPNETDPAALGLGTRYDKAMVALKDMANSDAFIASLLATLDGDKDWEKIFLNSAYVSKFNDSLEDSFLECTRKIIDINSPYLTNRVVQFNTEIITMIFGEEGEDRIAEASVGIGTEGNLDENASKDANKANTLNIGEMANNEVNVEINEVELEIQDGGDKEI